MPTSATHSIDALLQAAGVDVAAGVQITSPRGLRALHASMATLVLLNGTALPAETLLRYPETTGVVRISTGGDGLKAEVSTVATLKAEANGSSGAIVAVVLAAVPADEMRLDMDGLRGVIRRLRDPEGGCPWDLEQDHESLRPHLLEETYEVLSALDTGDGAALQEELGDLFMQIVLHAQIAEQNGDFDLDDVSEGIRAKLVRRHPHVFGDVEAETAEQVTANWDKIKAEERATKPTSDPSALDGVPKALPALQRAQSLTGRASRQGFFWRSDEDLLANITDELREIAEAATGRERQQEFGDLLFAMADFARRHDVALEDAVRETAEKFERRFRGIESALRAEGREMSEAGRDEQLRLWNAVKETEAAATKSRLIEE
jgi:MazG family protein